MHCSNPDCERSWGRVHGQDVPVRDRSTQPDCFIILDDELPGFQAKSKGAARCCGCPDACRRCGGAQDAGRRPLGHRCVAVGTGLPRPADRGGGCRPPSGYYAQRAWSRLVDSAAVRQMNEEGYQRRLALQQPAAPAGPTPPQPTAPAGPWDRPARLGGPAPATPVFAAVTFVPAAAGPGDQMPPTQSPRLGADRPALPKGGPSPGLAWEDIPTVGIDEEPAAPAAKAAAAPSPMVGAPIPPPEPVAPGGAAASSATPMVVEPAEIPHPTAAECSERANAAVRARGTELREVERRLAISMASAAEAQEEIRRLNVECAGWRRQRREVDASTEARARDADLRELRRILAECEERLAVARVMLLSLLER